MIAFDATAWITAVGPIIAAIIGASVVLAKRGTKEHMLARDGIERIETKVDGLTDSVVGHLEWHVDHPPQHEKKEAA